MLSLAMHFICDSFFPIVEDEGEIEPAEKVIGKEIGLGMVPVTQPDILLRVKLRKADGKHELEYTLDSPSGAVPFHTFLARQEVSSQTLSHPDFLYKRLEEGSHGFTDRGEAILRDELLVEVEAFGRELFDQLFPRELKDAYLAFRSSAKTFLLISDEGWIPWEVLRPYSHDSPEIYDDDFLCMGFEFTRWISGKYDPSQRIIVRNLLNVASMGSGRKEIPGVDQEADYLNRTAEHLGVNVHHAKNPTLRVVTQLLRDGDVDLFHFSGHANLPGSAGELAEIILDDRRLKTLHLSGPVGLGVRKSRPLVFLNAGATGRLQGWPVAWIRAGCGAFIGPAFNVSDRTAAEFSRSFYSHLEKGSTLGAATLGARKHLRETCPGDLGFLNYVPYGHPNCPVVFAAPAEEGDLDVKPRSSPASKIGGQDVDPVALGQIGSRGGARNDSPVGTDHLRAEDYAEAFVDLISSEFTHPPLTIGIYGPWGTGKSFLLGMIADRVKAGKLKGSNVVEFNAWEYSANKEIWPGMVRKIMESLEGQVGTGRLGRFVLRFRRNLRRQLSADSGVLALLGTAVIAVAALSFWSVRHNLSLLRDVLVILTAGGVIKLFADLVKSPVTVWTSRLFQRDAYGQQHSFMTEIRSDMEYLERKLRPRPQRRWIHGRSSRTRNALPGRIIVIIDDLDRCEPEQAVETLQAINLLLNYRSFIVFLGIDERVISLAVERHYKGILGEGGISGTEYLDKIVQIPFRIPVPEAEDLESFLYELMNAPEGFEAMSEPDEGVQDGEGDDLGRSFGETNLLDSQKGISTPKSTISSAMDERGGQITEDLPPFTHDEYLAFRRHSPYVSRNPRHLKRLLNVYWLVRSIAQKRGEVEILSNPGETVHFLVLCSQWPICTRLLLRYLDENTAQSSDDRGDEAIRVDPLREAFSRVSWGVQGLERLSSDASPEGLRGMCLEPHLPRASLAVLSVVRKYAINFNPGVLSVDLKGAAEEKNGEDSPVKQEEVDAESESGP